VRADRRSTGRCAIGGSGARLAAAAGVVCPAATTAAGAQGAGGSVDNGNRQRGRRRCSFAPGRRAESRPRVYGLGVTISTRPKTDPKLKHLNADFYTIRT